MAQQQQQTQGLADLPSVLPATARARIAAEPLDIKTGYELLQISKNIRVGGYGESGSGKTHLTFSMLEDSIENRAHDDEWIEEVFGHNPDLCNYVLGLPAFSPTGNREDPGRSDLLREAHQIVFLDWDDRGAEKLFAAFTANPQLYECVEYIGVKGWDDGMRATREAMKKIEEHLDRGLGSRGAWIVIDNIEEAWSEAASDYTRSTTGMTYSELRSQKRLQHPGMDQAARSAQSTAISKELDWIEIKSNHKEWIKPLLRMDCNLLVCAPPKERETETALPGGGYQKEKIPSIGGEKGVIFYLDWVVGLYQTADKTARYLRFKKCRWTGLTPRTLSNWSWKTIREEMQRLTEDHIRMQLVKHKAKKYLSEMPVEVSQWIKVRDPSKRIHNSDLPDVEVPGMSQPPASGGLASVQQAIPKPTIVAPPPIPPRPAEIPAPQVPAPVVPPAPTIPAPVIAPPVLPPPTIPAPQVPAPAVPIVPPAPPVPVAPTPPTIPPAPTTPPVPQAMNRDAIVAAVKAANAPVAVEALANHFGISLAGDEIEALDKIVFELLDEEVFDEPSLGMVVYKGPPAPEIPAPRAPETPVGTAPVPPTVPATVLPPPTIPAPQATPKRDATAEVHEIIKGMDTDVGVPMDQVIDASMKTGLAEADVDDAITELLDDGVLYEPALGSITTIKPKPEQDNPSLDTVVISKADHGRGAYHRAECGNAKRLSAPLVVTRDKIGNRKPCSKCKPDGDASE